jgi:hypothetical protein
MSQIEERCVRIVGVLVLAVSLLVALLLILQTKSLSQAAASGSIGAASVGHSLPPRSRVLDAELNLGLAVCGDNWIIETVDSAGDVGRSTSLALAPAYPYTPHLSYYDVTSDNLKYARLGGTTWFSQTIDSGGGWTSLALVPTYPYTPCIAYYDGASPNFWEWFLKYTCQEGTSWAIMMLSSNQRSGQTGTPLALEPTYPYTPHISSYNPWGTIVALHHSYLSGTIWMSGTWMYEQVEPSGSQAGTWSSLALEPTYPYTPHISYGATSVGLKHAWLSGTTWLSETVDSTGDVGWYTSLALDDGGNPHISYFDNTNAALKYAWLSGTTWLSVTVDSIGQSPYYGSGTSLELDQADAPYISYYDAISDDLKLAYFNGITWIIQTVDSEGDVGSFSSLALHQLGCPHISYYDATNDDLKYAYRPVFYQYLPVIFKD